MQTRESKNKGKYKDANEKIVMQFHEISCTFHWMSDFNFYGRKLPNSLQISEWTMAFLKQSRGNLANIFFYEIFINSPAIYHTEKKRLGPDRLHSL